MPTHKKTVGRVRWGVPGGAAMRLISSMRSSLLGIAILLKLLFDCLAGITVLLLRVSVLQTNPV